MSTTTESSEAAAPTRGRPRSEARRQAILQAAIDLLGDVGLTGASMDTLAERAGVSKATIYRWWPSKERLALDALYAWWDTTPPHPTGTLRDNLLGLVRPWVRLVADGASARILTGLIAAAHTDPQFAEDYRARFVEARRAPARDAFGRAIRRGEIAAGTDVEVAVDLLWGPLYHRLLHGHAPLDDRFAQHSVDTVLAGLLPREPPGYDPRTTTKPSSTQ